MIVAVLDTNVLASGIVGSRIPSSVPGALIAAWRRSAFILVLSEQILSNELPRTLAKPYFHSRLSTKEVDQILQLLRRRASVIAPAVQVTGVASHPEDDLILATAASVQPSILVSGDRHLNSLGTTRM